VVEVVVRSDWRRGDGKVMRGQEVGGVMLVVLVLTLDDECEGAIRLLLFQANHSR